MDDDIFNNTIEMRDTHFSEFGMIYSFIGVSMIEMLR